MVAGACQGEPLMARPIFFPALCPPEPPRAGGWLANPRLKTALYDCHAPLLPAAAQPSAHLPTQMAPHITLPAHPKAPPLTSTVWQARCRPHPPIPVPPQHPHPALLHSSTPRRDFYPDPGAPKGLQEGNPAVDFAFNVYGILNSSAAEDLVSNNTHFRMSWTAVAAPAYARFLQWSSRLVLIGGPAGRGPAGAHKWAGGARAGWCAKVGRRGGGQMMQGGGGRLPGKPAVGHRHALLCAACCLAAACGQERPTVGKSEVWPALVPTANAARPCNSDTLRAPPPPFRQMAGGPPNIDVCHVRSTNSSFRQCNSAAPRSKAALTGCAWLNVLGCLC